MITEIQDAAAKGLDDLSYLASTEMRAGWEAVESTWLSLERAAFDLEGASARTVRAAAGLLADELGAGYVLLRKLF